MIYRLPKEKGFTQINNQLINDNQLSTNAKAILIYMLSKTDTWQFYEADITKHFKDNAKVIKRGIKELQDKHYLRRERFHNHKTGKFIYTYDIFESPELYQEEYGYLSEIEEDDIFN